MKYRKLGKSGPEISVIGFGTWAIGSEGWAYLWGKQDDKVSIESIHAAIDSGVNLIDTAAAYGFGHAEEVVGMALKGRRDQAVIATKCGLRWDDQGNLTRNGSYASVMEEAEQSLRRLGTDYIDLYQMHWPDNVTNAPIEETMRAMDKLVQDGKIRYVGVSNFPVSLISDALKVRHIDSLQPPYSLLNRHVEIEHLSYCIRQGVGVIAYSPLASGLLSGNYNAHSRFGEQDWRSRSPAHSGEGYQRNIAVVEQLKPIARDPHLSVAELALAYVLAHPAVTSTLVGVRKPDHILSALKAADIKLDESVLATLREITQNAQNQVDL